MTTNYCICGACELARIEGRSPFEGHTIVVAGGPTTIKLGLSQTTPITHAALLEEWKKGGK